MKWFKKEPIDDAKARIHLLALNNVISLAEQASTVEEFDLFREALVYNTNAIWKYQGIKVRVTIDTFDTFFKDMPMYDNVYKTLTKLQGKI